MDSETGIKPNRFKSRIFFTMIVTFFIAMSPMSPVGPAAAAEEAAYISCDLAVYNKKASATIRCDAASSGEVRTVSRCWNGPIPVDHVFGSWISVGPSAPKILTFQAGSWCQAWYQTWDMYVEVR